ncbi:hypothetical protein [Nocardioides nanhaiensis]|uniref:Uncharacterized protein n=1 Tax=Nocardioides nanhaiensis TaxID=1476871 RepID=A0ABP8W2V8_9ACTN
MRALLLVVALLLPLALAAPASADGDVVRDDSYYSGLRLMKVDRSPEGMRVLTYFSTPYDKHLLRVREPGRKGPTFTITWRTDGTSGRYVVVRTARFTALGPARTVACRTRAVPVEGRENRRMVFSVPAECLRLRTGVDLPRLAVDQRAYEVTGTREQLLDSMPFTRPLVP